MHRVLNQTAQMWQQVPYIPCGKQSEAAITLVSSNMSYCCLLLHYAAAHMRCHPRCYVVPEKDIAGCQFGSV